MKMMGLPWLSTLSSLDSMLSSSALMFLAFWESFCNWLMLACAFWESFCNWEISFLRSLHIFLISAMPTLLLLTGFSESAADADGLLGEGTWACSSSGADADDDDEALAGGADFLDLDCAMEFFFSCEFETWNVAHATVTFVPSLRPENRRHVTFHVSVVQTSARRL